MAKTKTYREDYKITISGIEYTVSFVIIRGHEIFAYLYKGNECLHYWPKLKQGNQKTADLLANEYVTKLSETIIK
jgi:hypothetical protein